MLRILQISDTHLRPGLAERDANWQAIVAHVEATRPDLVINTGDIANDVPTGPHDLAYAHELHDALPTDWRAIPGNHDIGDHWGPGEAQTASPINDDHRARYQELFGDEWWASDRDGWRLIGMNAQLMGSGEEGEDKQWRDIEYWLDTAMGPVAMFIHKPLFLDDPREQLETFRYLQPPARNRLLALIGSSTTRLVASGHSHQHREVKRRTVTYSWAPSTAFIIDPAKQEDLGNRTVGVVEITLDGDRVETNLVVPDNLQPISIGAL